MLTNEIMTNTITIPVSDLLAVLANQEICPGPMFYYRRGCHVRSVAGHVRQLVDLDQLRRSGDAALAQQVDGFLAEAEAHADCAGDLGVSVRKVGQQLPKGAAVFGLCDEQGNLHFACSEIETQPSSNCANTQLNLTVTITEGAKQSMVAALCEGRFGWEWLNEFSSFQPSFLNVASRVTIDAGSLGLIDMKDRDGNNRMIGVFTN